MAKELDALMSEFTSRQRLNQPERDDQGRYFFVFDGDLEISLFQSGDRIFVEGYIGELPQERDSAEALLERMLHRHLARLRDKHEVLSINPEDGQLVLFRQLSARILDIRDLEKVLGEFINGLEFCSNEFLQVPKQTTAPPPMHMLFP